MELSVTAPQQMEHAFGRELAALGRSAWRGLTARLRRARGRVACRFTSLAVFDVSELGELRQIFGDDATRHTVAEIRRALGRIDPRKGKVSRTSATSFCVLLPGYDAQAAVAAVHRALGETLAIESDWQGEELVVVPDFLVRSAGESPESVRSLYRKMLGEISGQQQSVQRHRDYIRRERESYFPTTRPGLLPGG